MQKRAPNPPSNTNDELDRNGGETRQKWRLVAGLAFADYRHEWVLSACSVLALAAVLIPLLVLFGLRYGIVANLLDPLIENPRYREIAPVTSGHFSPEWFESMRARPDVAFVVPRTRSLAATIRLRKPDSEVGRIIDVELIPSAPGDPVLSDTLEVPEGFRAALLSAAAAERLQAAVGDRVEGIVTRTRGGEVETVRLPLEVQDIAPPAAFARDGLFVSHALLIAVEDFLDGRAVPALGWEGNTSRGSDRAFAGFRMYARTLSDVARVRADLLEQHIDVRTSIADISLVQTLDRNLGIVYWIIAAMAIAGYCLSFATSVWANVDRKRRDFSVLRLTGFRTRDIVWFPIVQAAFTAAAAWVLACVAYFAIEAVLNGLFAASIGGGEPVCRIRVWHLALALGLTLVAATLAAAGGGMRVAQLEPSVGLR